MPIHTLSLGVRRAVGVDASKRDNGELSETGGGLLSPEEEDRLKRR